MLAYAPRPDRHRFRPTALALIIGAHVVAIAAVMSARMQIPVINRDPPTVIDPIPLPPKPPEVPPEPRKPTQEPDSHIDNVPTPLPPIPNEQPIVDQTPFPPLPPAPEIGPGNEPRPVADPPIVRTGPRFATPAHLLKPPYPEEKRRLEQEAILKLRLSIGADGRISAVEPVGKADAAFLEAARRHILRSWRYKPATEGGNAIASSTVITLEFRLD